MCAFAQHSKDTEAVVRFHRQTLNLNILTLQIWGPETSILLALFKMKTKSAGEFESQFLLFFA